MEVWVQYLERKEKVSVGKDYVTVEDVIKVLPDEIGETFLLAVNKFQEEPDNIKRNMEYNGFLTEFSKRTFGGIFAEVDWKNKWSDWVVLEGISEEIGEALMDIGFEFSKRGRGGFNGACNAFCHMDYCELESGKTLVALNRHVGTWEAEDNKITFPLVLEDWKICEL